MYGRNSACILIWALLFVSDVLNQGYTNDDTQYFRHKRQSESTECTLPPHPVHGSWKVLNGDGSPGDGVLTASVLTFKCKPGYKLSSNIPLVCLGQWSSSVPECEELCPPLYPSTTYDLRCIDKIGKEVNCSEATHGTNLEYTCKTYYEAPFGYKKTLFCENGKWDNVKPVCQPACGKKVTNDTKMLIYGSKPNKKIEHPWVAAIYTKLNDSYENICGGSILSQTVVLTAAHCVTNDYGDVLPKKDYRVGVGKIHRKYQAPEDTHAQYFELFKIVIPEDYKGDIRKYTADIAVLVVKKEITLSEVVRPVCFTDMKNIHLHAGNKGEVSGWGLAEGDIPSEVLRTLVIPYKNEMICADELPPDWADRYNVRDKICAGFVNKSTSVCSGDSGGGLAFKYREDNRYYIHGIVSIAHQVGYMCNIQQNALYTSVASHYEFVDRLLTRYAPKIKDCVLPLYPQNGKWTTNEQGSKPGDAVPSNTVLKVKCDKGFKLSSTRIVECGTAYKMPTCKMHCPKPDLPQGTNYYCTNKDGQEFDCSAAVEGSILYYYCPRRYKEVDDSPNRTCIRGSWGSPTPECIRECGKRLIDESGAGSEHPWNVAVYKLTNNPKEKYKYVCGGSLVSEYVVVTAAQCVTDETGRSQSIDNYLIATGKLYRKYEDPREQHAQYTNVTYINIHPEYKLSKGTGYNVALIIVSISFVFNSFIQPVCVAINTDRYIDNNYETTGMMTGWRFTDGVSPETIQSVEVDVVSGSDCNVPSDLSVYAFPVQNRCSQFKNESTCLLPEDRGKGVVVKHKEKSVYYLEGIILYFKNKGCQKKFWFTDVTGFTDLIYFTASHL